MAEWQPIDTAPKDGTRVLIWHRLWECGWQQGYYSSAREERFCTWRIGDDREWSAVGIPPSHWLGIPAPPTEDV